MINPFYFGELSSQGKIGGDDVDVLSFCWPANFSGVSCKNFRCLSLDLCEYFRGLPVKQVLENRRGKSSAVDSASVVENPVTMNPPRAGADFRRRFHEKLLMRYTKSCIPQDLG